MSTDSSVLQGLRRPEYTGENRCLPCTAVNVAIAIVVSLFASIVRIPFGVAVFGVSLLAIYLRGYLVPGTPSLTKRYLPESVLSQFDHGNPAAAQEWETLEKLEYEREHAVDPEAFLREAGAIRDRSTEADDSRSGPEITDQFQSAIAERTTTLATEGVTSSDLADVFQTDPESIAFADRDYPAARVDARIRPWPSETALHTDVATDATLADWADDWRAVPLEQRVDVLAALRSFHERCPTCEGTVEFDETVVESCCRSHEVVTFACEDCGAHLVELPASAGDGDLLADAERS